MARGGGDQATYQAPKTCRPNAAQSVVPGGLRAHTRETVSLSPRGVADRAGSGADAPSRPLIRSPGGTSSVWGGSVCTLRGPGDNGEEMKRRATARMLSRTGWDRDCPLGRAQTREGERAPWGCAAGAP